MRSIINFVMLFAGVTLFFISCEKVKDLPYNKLGNPVTLTPSATTVTPTAGDSTKTVLTLNWSFPNYATDSANMKYVVEIDSTGRNFAKEVTKTITKNLSTTFTGRDLNTLLLNYGYSVGTPVKLDIRVTSSYANNNEKYISNVVQVTVTPFADPSKLVTEKTTVTGTLATASQHSNTFTWSPAFPGYTGTVTYIIQYDSAGKNFVSPQVVANAGGASVYTKSMTQAEMNTTAINSGIPIDTKTGKVEYRVKATTASGAVAYSNVVNVTITTYIPILRFYLPGSYQVASGYGPNDWDPTTAPELIRDLRSAVFNSMYYTYIFLPAGAQFKVTQGRSWDVNYGGTGGTLAANGANFSVTNAGVYRVTIDLNTMKYDIKQGRMGLVGDAIPGNNWTPGAVFPASQMAFLVTNKFLGVDSLVAGGWKMIDNDQWNNGSNAADETRSYGSTGPSGSTMEVNGANFPNITTAATYRVIWDGTNVDNIKYEISHGLRVVGNFQGWDPSTATPMAYSGNGKWTITMTLPAGDFKFVSADGWVFNYGGTGGKISRDGPNLNVAAGTYTITVDEYNQTYTIL